MMLNNMNDFFLTWIKLMMSFLPKNVLSHGMLLRLYSSICHFCSDVSQSNFREQEKKILDNIIGPGNYDKRIRPAGANDTGMYFSFFIILYILL